MGKTTWTAADWREKRARQREAKNDYDLDDPFYHRRFIEAGRELVAMMELPALDWPTSKWAKEQKK